MGQPPKCDESGMGRDESGAPGTNRANSGTNPPLAGTRSAARGEDSHRRLGRAGSWPEVHAAGNQWRCRTHAAPSFSIDIHSLSPLPDARSRQARQAAGLGETPRKREKKATPEGKAMRAIVADVPLAGLSSIDRAILYSQDQFPVTIGGRHEPSKGIHDRDHRQATGRQHLR